MKNQLSDRERILTTLVSRLSTTMLLRPNGRVHDADTFSDGNGGHYVHFAYYRCPVNGKGIKYTLEVHTGAVLMAEDLRAHVDAIGEGLHEEIADALLAKFGGSQRLEAEHHGVHIKTIRPHLAHWAPAN